MKKLVLTLIALMALFTLFRAVSVFADKTDNAGQKTAVSVQD
jgi:hypothetical protein